MTTATFPLAKPHAVYRIYGPHDLILYIGMSKDPRGRLAFHKCMNKGTWWPFVERTEIQWYANYVEAATVETAELRAHRPPCNPVIPEANGKHVTITAGRKAKRSLWAQVAELDSDVPSVITRALEMYVELHKREVNEQG